MSNKHQGPNGHFNKTSLPSNSGHKSTFTQKTSKPSTKFAILMRDRGEVSQSHYSGHTPIHVASTKDLISELTKLKLHAPFVGINCNGRGKDFVKETAKAMKDHAPGGTRIIYHGVNPELQTELREKLPFAIITG